MVVTCGLEEAAVLEGARLVTLIVALALLDLGTVIMMSVLSASSSSV